ncbi:MAG: hypothetical protein ACC707_03520 [Thiohalomonadales bacterium]
MRNRTLQRRIIATILFLGLFSQFQNVFACEYKDGKLQLVCCCDEPGDMSKDCEQNDACNDSGIPVTSEKTCCEVSFHAGLSATIIGTERHVPQVLLLDAPQPPPLLTSFVLQALPTPNYAIRINSELPPTLIGSQTYRLTQRLRL